MSRIGKRVLTLPESVTVTVDGNVVTVKGPKGELSTTIDENVKVEITGNELRVHADENLKNIHGTTNAHIKNMIEGVTNGFEKKLEAIGVGYRFSLKGNILVISVGFSHPVEMEIPEGITVELPSNTQLIVKGIDKFKVGEFAANIRKVRKPEPYKGKGIRYSDEVVIRKAGKKAA
ncbi:MAG: 50S ribosomal protein L6 [Mollicutes bacterium]|jgi:large subunit ribosomal protein L6|nr:50S ribosomal protein L6 [Mollicutes bacterium]